MLQDDNPEWIEECCSFFRDKCDNLAISELIRDHRILSAYGSNFKVHGNVLVCALNNNRMDKFKALLENDEVDPNQRYGFNIDMMVLRFALKYENVEAIRLLLDHGADVLPNDNNFSSERLFNQKMEVIPRIAKTGNTVIFDMLMHSKQFNCFLYASNQWGFLNLIKNAIKDQFFDIAKIVIEMKLLDQYAFDIDLFNKTIPHVNGNEKAFEFANYLIQKLPRIDYICTLQNGGQILYDNPIQIVCEYCDNEEQRKSLIKALLKKGSEQVMNLGRYSKKYLQNALFDIIDMQNEEALSLVIAEGVSLGLNHYWSEYFSYPLSPLAYAVKRGNVGIIKMLLDAGADPNLTDDEERPMLSFVKENANTQEIMQILMEAGSKMDANDVEGIGSLHYASVNCHDDNDSDNDSNQTLEILFQTHYKYLQDL